MISEHHDDPTLSGQRVVLKAMAVCGKFEGLHGAKVGDIRQGSGVLDEGEDSSESAADRVLSIAGLCQD